MTVHSFHIFDRRGKTLFTKRYIKNYGVHEDEEQLSEQRKLVFGMLFSLRELSSSLSPSAAEPGELKMVKTGASALYNYETVSGLRFVLYTTPETSYSTNDGSGPQSPANSAKETKITEGQTSPAVTGKIRAALKHIYEHIWVTFVIRSPMYQPDDPNVEATNFEASLDSYLKGMPWFR